MNTTILRKKSKNWGDYILAVTATIQSLIMLFQLLAMDSGFLSEDGAAKVRIIFSAIFVFLSVPWIIKRNSRLALQSLFFIIFIFSHSLIISPENKDAIFSEGVKLTLCTCLPIFLCTSSIRNIDIFYKSCLFVSVACSILGILYSILFITGNLPMLEQAYNMSYGYALLFPAMFFLYKNKIGYTIVAFILLILIVIIGSRGPLIPFIGYYVWLHFFKGKKSERIKVLLLIIGIILLFPLIILLLSFFEINSRTIYFIVEGYMDSTSGRESITDIIWQKILNQPLCGYGIFADRVFMNGSYCHNIILELFLNFGLFVPITIFMILLPYVFNLWRNLVYPNQDFFILLALASIFPLLLSSSYLIDFRIAMFLGFIYKFRKEGFKVKLRKRNVIYS